MATRDRLWETGHDESVEVNQRALIDKVLARYSGEFTVFRELLQNSDDAQSKTVEIRFNTESFVNGKRDNMTHSGESEGLPNLKTVPVHQWVFKNNGILFRDEDWDRLKKIAEGNPDEQKIGAFGVGFYSLFSVTEEPFVTSGDQWMGFYWKDKKDQLFARRGKLDEASWSPWTVFEMALREASPIPPAFDFARFLASSITFMTYIEEVSVYLNDWCLVKLTKATGPPQPQQLPRGLSRTTPNGYMTVSELKITPVTIQASVMNGVYASGTEVQKRIPPKLAKPVSAGFFSSLLSSIAGNSTVQRPSAPAPFSATPVDPLKASETKIVLSVFSANIAVRLNSKLSSEIYRSTKKNPPSTMKYELIYTAKDKYDASKKEDSQHLHTTGSIFQGLRADLDGIGSARIFIGHATAQTTGIGGHMAARFIPTVEREAIDFMDRNVAVWNRELLYIGGLLARTAYQLEIDSIRERWDINTEFLESSHLPQELRSLLVDKAIHTLKFFTFHQSTPSAEVSSILETAFFKCDTSNNLPLISTHGIRNASQIRLPDPSFTFLKQLPLLPDELASEPMIITMQSKGMIKSITFDDVLSELKSRPLPEGDMISCIKWWISLYEPRDTTGLASVRTQLLQAAILVFSTHPSGEERIIPLHTIRTIPNQRILNGLPPDAPLPPHLLPPSLVKHFSLDDLRRAFPWVDLTMYDWLSHICDPMVARENPAYDIESSAHWAEKILSFVARNWSNSLSAASHDQIVNLLGKKSCIPTSGGIKQPSESYFPSADIFHDLPIVKLPSGNAVKGSIEKLLQALGVRKHIDLQIIFNRMIKTNEWTINDLTRYLVSVKSDLKDEEIRRLGLTAAFPREQPEKEKDEKARPQRFRADQLYEPLPVFRQLELPVIDWGSQLRWRSNSEEARFLFSLGLKRHPPVQELIQLCTNPNPEIHTTALRYLVDNMATKYTDYDPDHYRDVAFIPALDGSRNCLGTPRQVFAKSEWSHLGFLVIHPSIQADATKLKIREHPTANQLVDFLQKTRPINQEEARQWFSILSIRVSEFSHSQLSRLSETSFVPVEPLPSVAGSVIRWLAPSRCYLGQQTPEKFHSKLFVFVNFGMAGNIFLTACGAKQEPTVEEVAKILLENPHRFYELSQGPNNFLNELRNIAVNRTTLSSSTVARMKKAPILLCYKRKPTDQEPSKVSGEDDLEDEDWDIGYDLKPAEQIVVADDTNAHQVFGSDLFTAPQEDIIEVFYSELGSRRLSSLVKEEHTPGAEIPNSKRAISTRTLILERLPIFLHEHNHARMRVSLDWLQSEANFRVKTYGQIKVRKTLIYGKLHLEKKQEASAIARRGVSQRIELLLANNAEIDMYEVAMCLNRLIFESPKAHDALLFMTILSTDLRALKRRGYNVDRILRQRRLEEQAAEARLRQERITLLSQAPSQAVENEALPTSSTSQLTPNPVSEKAQGPSILDTLQKIKHKVSGLSTSGQGPAPDTGRAQDQLPSSSNNSKRDSHDQESLIPGAMPGGFLGGLFPREPNRVDNPTITSLNNIATNIEMAIKACRPEASNTLHNRQDMHHVKEIDNDGYCDVSGHAQNMKSAGSMGNVKIFVAQDLPGEEVQSILTVKLDVIARLIHIMTSLAGVYNLNLANLHIFYDTKGVLIAFNRGGSIFLNLRYYEAWHDSEVRQGNMDKALIAWYFTLAHEIAHNLVQPHNSEHEFYFSAICERHLASLCKVLQGTGK